MDAIFAGFSRGAEIPIFATPVRSRRFSRFLHPGNPKAPFFAGVFGRATGAKIQTKYLNPKKVAKSIKLQAPGRTRARARGLVGD